MSAFEFYISFYGLLLGLSVAEVASGLANAVGSRRSVILGKLTPLLACFLLLDISSFWIFAWGAREALQVNWHTMFGGLGIAVVYYLAAALVFPRQIGEWSALDDHYWAHKRLVIGGIILANLALVILALAYLVSPYRDPAFWLYQLIYWLPLVGLMVSRSRRIDLALLVFAIAQYLINFVVPSSALGDALIN